MPIEFAVLDGQECRINVCPKCGADPFDPFLRGMVQRSQWFVNLKWPFVHWRTNYCALICWACKEIVGYE